MSPWPEAQCAPAKPLQNGKSAGDQLAGGLGFEPRLTESESAVLPLNYPPMGVVRAYLTRLAGSRKAAQPHYDAPAGRGRGDPSPGGRDGPMAERRAQPARSGGPAD